MSHPPKKRLCLVAYKKLFCAKKIIRHNVTTIQFIPSTRYASCGFGRNENSFDNKIHFSFEIRILRFTCQFLYINQNFLSNFVLKILIYMYVNVFCGGRIIQYQQKCDNFRARREIANRRPSKPGIQVACQQIFYMFTRTRTHTQHLSYLA